MKVIEHIKNAKNPIFSFEIIPPKRGNNVQEIIDIVKALEPFHPPYIDVTSHSAEAYYNIGHSHHKLGQLDKAVRSYKKVVDIKPEYAENHTNKILSVIYYFSIEQIPEALDVLEILIKSSPVNS